MELLPQHMQADILPSGTPPTNPYPIYFMGCFSHTSSSHRDLPRQTYAHILYGMFLLHIQAEIMPTRISSHKPVPSTFSKGCFSCMFRLKWCYMKLPQSHAHSALCLSYTARLKSWRQGITPTNPCSLCSTGCFSYISRLKRCLQGTPPTNSSAVLSRGSFSYNPG